MYTVYVLKSEKGSLCVGQTQNLQKRLEQHNTGISRYTKRYTSWQLIYQEDFPTRVLAMRREKELKTGVGRDFLRKKLQAP